MSETSKPTPGPWYADKAGAIWRRHPSELYENGGGVAGDKPLAVVQKGWHETCEQGYPVESNARLIAAAPELLGEIESTYEWLADIHHNWPGRHSPVGQMRLIRLRNLISKATGRDEQDVQDDFGMRVVLANAERKT